MMRKVKSHLPAGDVHLSSSAPASVDRAYHKILKPVKGRGVTTPFWGCSVGYKTVGKMITKLAYWSSGILHNVRQESLVKEEVVKHWH